MSIKPMLSGGKTTFMCTPPYGDSSEIKLSNDFFQTFPKCSQPNPVSKRTIKKIGHHALKKNMMAQSYGILGL